MMSISEIASFIANRLLGHLLAGERSARRFRQAGLAIIANVLSKALGFVVIIYSTRVALEQLGTIRFGVWVTIASVATLLGFLDFGVANAVIGRVAALNSGSVVDRRLTDLVTGALGVLTLTGSAVAIILCIIFAVSPLATWFKGITLAVASEARTTGYTFGAFFGLSLAAQGVVKVYAGLQYGWIANLTSAVGWLISIALIGLAPRLHAPMWFYLVATYGIQQLAGLSLLFGLHRRGLIETPRNAVRAVKALQGDALLFDGRQFFVIQIAFAIGWGANQMILSSIVGPGEAGIFSVLQRYFMIVQVALTIVNLPLWAMYADAYANAEYKFIRGLFRRSLLLTFLFSIVGVTILVLGSPQLLPVIEGGRIAVPIVAIVLMAIWTILEAYGIAQSMYLNGVGRIRPQAICGTIQTIAGLPLKIIAVHFWGLNGLIAAIITGYGLLVAIPLVTIFRSECFDGIFNRTGKELEHTNQEFRTEPK